VRAVVLNCSLKGGDEPSHTQMLADVVIEALDKQGVSSLVFRLADHSILPGVSTNMGSGDGWPAIHDAISEAEILVFATPTWVGRPSSLAQRALERLDAMISETDDHDRPVAYNKVAGVVVTGNEDGAHTSSPRSMVPWSISGSRSPVSRGPTGTAARVRARRSQRRRKVTTGRRAPDALWRRTSSVSPTHSLLHRCRRRRDDSDEKPGDRTGGSPRFHLYPAQQGARVASPSRSTLGSSASACGEPVDVTLRFPDMTQGQVLAISDRESECF
jgi:multimeric flavodoxin WrbA